MVPSYIFKLLYTMQSRIKLIKQYSDIDISGYTKDQIVSLEASIKVKHGIIDLSSFETFSWKAFGIVIQPDKISYKGGAIICEIVRSLEFIKLSWDLKDNKMSTIQEKISEIAEYNKSLLALDLVYTFQVCPIRNKPMLNGYTDRLTTPDLKKQKNIIIFKKMNVSEFWIKSLYAHGSVLFSVPEQLIQESERPLPKEFILVRKGLCPSGP